MTNQVATLRDAVLVEAIGDVQHLIDRVEELASQLKEAEERVAGTAKSLEDANSQYRAQVDDMLARLRADFASFVTKVAEHAATSLVGQQTEILQRAATAAMRKTLTEEAITRARSDWYRLAAFAAAVGGGSAALVAAIAILVFR